MAYNTKYDAELKIWSGPEKNKEYFELVGIDYEKSIGEQIFERMKNNSERICQITDPDGTILTHGEVLDFGIQIALYLRKLKMSKDDIVGIIAKNTTMVLPIIVGCWLNCTPFFSLYPESDRKLVAHLFGLTRPKVVFADADDYTELIEGCKLIKLLPKVFTFGERIAGVPNLQELLEDKTDVTNFQPTKLEDGPNQTSIYMCTSGTTGLPKCMHMSNLQVLAEYRPFDCDFTFFTFSNPSWITSIVCINIVLLSSCTSIVTSAPAEPELFFELIPKYKINHTIVAPGFLAQLVKCFHDKPRDLTSIFSISTGGSVITEPIIRQTCDMLTDGFLQTLYGATECGTASFNINFEKPKSVGNLLPGIRVKIINEVDQSLGCNEMGEILVNNGRVWRGYVDNEKETAAMYDADGWFHTGDLGYFDADADLYVVDRKKDALKFRTTTYSPSEIEQVIAELPDVIEVCVFGIPHDIDLDRAAAAVILKSNGRLTELDIKQYVAAKLPYHLNLHGGVYFMKAFPRTSSGKVIRREIRDMTIAQINNSAKFSCKL